MRLQEGISFQNIIVAVLFHTWNVLPVSSSLLKPQGHDAIRTAIPSCFPHQARLAYTRHMQAMRQSSSYALNFTGLGDQPQPID